MSSTRLVLASKSPRRSKLLREYGAAFEVLTPEVAEVHWDDRPVDTVRENARRKVDWCRARTTDAAVIAADTVVVFDGRTIGKPRDLDEARAFLMAFSGRHQLVHTGVALALPGVEAEVHVATSDVIFRRLDHDTITRYFEQVDPLDKAGGYDIDQYGHLFIHRHEGSWSNIMGLPMEVVTPWLARYGLGGA